MMTHVRRWTPFWARVFPTVWLAGWTYLLPRSARAAVAATAAAPCAFAWDASANGGVAGYVVYYHLIGSSTTNRLDVGAGRTVTIYNLTASSNYLFYVAAYNAVGLEGSPSNPVFYCPPALSPLRLAALADGTTGVSFRTAPGAVCSVQYTASLFNPQWQTLGSARADASGMVNIIDPLPDRPPDRYYRAVR